MSRRKTYTGLRNNLEWLVDSPVQEPKQRCLTITCVITSILCRLCLLNTLHSPVCLCLPWWIPGCISQRFSYVVCLAPNTRHPCFRSHLRAWYFGGGVATLLTDVTKRTTWWIAGVQKQCIIRCFSNRFFPLLALSLDFGICRMVQMKWLTRSVRTQAPKYYLKSAFMRHMYVSGHACWEKKRCPRILKAVFVLELEFLWGKLMSAIQFNNVFMLLRFLCYLENYKNWEKYSASRWLLRFCFYWYSVAWSK